MIFKWQRLCRVSVCALLLYALAGLTGVYAQTLSSNRPPAGNFNLTNWYLGLPVDSSGGTSGGSASISAAQLTGGYSNALYFYTGPDGAMTFWAPVTGATTSGSDYPRSELREQISPPSNDINWRGYGKHILNATCKVTEVPSTQKVIIGQIHTKTGSARPLVKLQYSSGTIEALVKVYASNTMPNTDNKLTFQNVGLNNPVDYTIRMEDGLVTVTVNGLSKSTNTYLTDPDWANQEFYFKAGSYCQDNVGATNEGARVAFYALSRSHAPSIINHPASISVAAGGTTNFSVSASGNGTLLYQWRRNGTNLSPNATSASLTLTNIQLVHAGDYSVKVTDNLGSVTSVVATLTVTNAPPSFTSNPINRPGATVGASYGGSLADHATDSDTDEILTFDKVSGPPWLSVAGDGTLSGIPGAGDVGLNSWTVRVTDLAGTFDEATLNITVNAATSGGTSTNVIVNDSFTDGNRANTGPLQAAWWSSSSPSGNSVEITLGTPNTLGLVSGSSGRGIHGTFAPQTLVVGETLMATFTFKTPATVGNNLASSFRVALMDFNDPGLAADLSSSSSSANPLYVGQPGYMVDYDVNTGGTSDIQFRKHSLTATSGRFLGTTAEWDALGNSSADAGYVFTANTEYVGVFAVTRTGTDSLSLFSSISNDTGTMDSHSEDDLSGIANNFGMLGFWANSGVFGANTTAGDPDNGVEFSNIRVEVVSPVAAPPMLQISHVGTNVILFWTASGSAGYNLESTPDLTTSAWSPAGAPTLSGGINYVTNAVSGGPKYYRLKK